MDGYETLIIIIVIIVIIVARSCSQWPAWDVIRCTRVTIQQQKVHSIALF
jgi:hypothetical protein